MQQIGHLTGQLDAAVLGRLAHLVAGGVRHHAGVGLVLGHHICQVLAPPLVKVIHVVVLGLVDVPVVDVLVHHQDAQAVAGVEKGARAGVMCAAQRVVALLAHEKDLALDGVGPGAGAQDAVVVVDAGALQDHTLAVEQKTVVAPLQGADAKGGLGLVALASIGRRQGNAAQVELRIVRRPQARAGHVKLQGCAAIRAHRHLAGRQGLLAIKRDKLDHGLASTGGLDVHGHAGRRARADPGRKGAHAHAVALDVGTRTHPQGHGPVDARSRVPTAVGLIRIFGHHADLGRHVGGEKIT